MRTHSALLSLPATPSNTKAPAHKILPLTSLRFFAAFYVVLFHTGIPFIHTFGVTGNWLGTGYISVSFFFVLSGYILAFVYLIQRNSINKSRFWAARFARIYPLFFISSTIDTNYLLHDRIVRQGVRVAVLKTAITYLANLFMLQAWILKLRGINDPNWSLSVETCFYLLFPWIGKAIWRLTTKPSIIAGVLMYFFSMSSVWIAYHHGISQDVIKFNPLFHISEFSLGILLAKWHATLNSCYHHQLNRASLSMSIIGTSCLIVILKFSYIFPMLLLHDGLLFPIFGCIILGLASGNNLITQALSLPFLVLLGEASYALYLLHIPIWHWMIQLDLARYTSTYPLYLAMCIILSIFSFYKLEVPLRKIILVHFLPEKKIE
jgi:peptidoglycan/LPS O-acetylase OafA/YrhL